MQVVIKHFCICTGNIFSSLKKYSFLFFFFFWILSILWKYVLSHCILSRAHIFHIITVKSCSVFMPLPRFFLLLGSAIVCFKIFQHKIILSRCVLCLSSWCINEMSKVPLANINFLYILSHFPKHQVFPSRSFHWKSNLRYQIKVVITSHINSFPWNPSGKRKAYKCKCSITFIDNLGEYGLVYFNLTPLQIK